MKKINYFEASKDMSKRVEDFVKCRILRREISLDYQAKIKVYRDAIANGEKLKGSILYDAYLKDAEKYTAEIERLEKEREDQLAKEATFTLTEGDKTFKKSVKGTRQEDNALKDAIRAWFKNYGLDTCDTYLEGDIIASCGDKADFKHLVETEGAEIKTIDETRALQMLYWTAFEQMVKAGTIKPAQIPECIRAKYTKKSK